MDDDRRKQIDRFADHHGGASERVLQEALREVLSELDDLGERYYRVCTAMANAQQITQEILDDRTRLLNAVGPVMRAWAYYEEEPAVIGGFEQDYPVMHTAVKSMADALAPEEPFTCSACGREEADCSTDPCADVKADREEPS